MLSEEEAIKEIEDYLDYEGSVSIQAIATLYTSYNKEKEKNKLLIDGKFREVADKNSYIKDNYISKDKIKAKIEIRKEEKENCKDSIEEKYLLREIYVLQSLLEKE